jgi:protein-S-isoprenylcysteine O-methyltransferase Ste14
MGYGVGLIVAGLKLAKVEASNLPRLVMVYAVIGCWWLFGLTFWLRKNPPREQESQQTASDRSSLLGLVLQAAAYLIVWFEPLRMRHLVPATSWPPTAEWVLAAITVGLAMGSVLLVIFAARCLGKQWALTARVVEGHSLIQDGPYRFVRNPIYTGMFGLLLATGIAAGHWIALLAANVLFIAGTWIRIRSEERLLRQTFGSEFEVYAKKVWALIPGVY